MIELHVHSSADVVHRDWGVETAVQQSVVKMPQRRAGKHQLGVLGLRSVITTTGSTTSLGEARRA